MLNNSTFIGRVTKEPELSMPEGENKKAFCCFQLAVRRNNGETDYPECVCYGSKAESFCKFIHKGDLVCVSADYHSHFFNGIKQHEFVVYKFELIRNQRKGGDDVEIPQ